MPESPQVIIDTKEFAWEIILVKKSEVGVNLSWETRIAEMVETSLMFILRFSSTFLLTNHQKAICTIWIL